MKAYLILIACLIRVSTNLLWPFVGGAELYYLGQAMFEVLIMYVLFSFSEGWLKYCMNFFFGLSCFALLKEFIKPTELDLNEYIGFAVGASFVAYQLWKTSKK